jgi:hypothetical protein
MNLTSRPQLREFRAVYEGQLNHWAKVRLSPHDPQPYYLELPPLILIVVLPQMKDAHLVIKLTNQTISPASREHLPQPF